jgi:hypothetical protein
LRSVFRSKLHNKPILQPNPASLHQLLDLQHHLRSMQRQNVPQLHPRLQPDPPEQMHPGLLRKQPIHFDDKLHLPKLLNLLPKLQPMRRPGLPQLFEQFQPRPEQPLHRPLHNGHLLRPDGQKLQKLLALVPAMRLNRLQKLLRPLRA